MQDPQLLEFAWVELLEKNKPVTPEELAEVPYLSVNAAVPGRSFDNAFLIFRLFMVAQILSKAIVLIFYSQKTRYTFLYWSQKVLDQSTAPAALNRYYFLPCIHRFIYVT